MREATTSSGIGHGALCHEDALGSWFLFIEHASKVSAGSIRRQTDSSSFKHPDTAIAAKTRNSLAVETIIEFLEENNPFDSDTDKCDLICLGTGLTDRTGESNSKTAKKFGEEFYQISVGYPCRRLSDFRKRLLISFIKYSTKLTIRLHPHLQLVSNGSC